METEPFENMKKEFAINKRADWMNHLLGPLPSSASEIITTTKEELRYTSLEYDVRDELCAATPEELSILMDAALIARDFKWCNNILHRLNLQNKVETRKVGKGRKNI